MKSLIHKLLIVILLVVKLSPTYSQTFSVADNFIKKSNSKVIKTDALIIKLRTVKEKDTIVVYGEILDRETKSMMIGVTVTENATTNGTSTDDQGIFKLKVDNSSPILDFSFNGFASEQVSLPKIENETEDDNSLSSLSGLLIANLGEETIFQPNIMFSQDWKIGRHGIELRILGLQSNKDTVQISNGLNLIKPEISKINLRLSGEFIPFTKLEAFSINGELNIFRQQLNLNNQVNVSPLSDDITSLLCKFTAGYSPADGLHFFASAVYYNVFEGVEFYEERFGEIAIKKFWNFELAGKFILKDGALKGTFVQALFNVNSNNYKQLLNTKDSGVFLIRMGFNKILKR